MRKRKNRVYVHLTDKELRQLNAIVYRDIDTDTEICSFNMDCYKAPKLPDYLARSIIESCRKFYSDPENVKKYEELKKAR